MGRAHAKEKYAIHDFLKTVLDKKEEGFCSYSGGWNDRKVADEFAVSINVVSGVRRASFGRILPIPEQPRSVRTEDRLDAIEARMDHLEAEFARRFPRLL